MIATLYDNVCTPCARKRAWTQFKQKCAREGLKTSRRDVSRDLEARDYVKSITPQVYPFVVMEDGKIISFQEFVDG